jgi:hypothetical protein
VEEEAKVEFEVRLERFWEDWDEHFSRGGGIGAGVWGRQGKEGSEGC